MIRANARNRGVGADTGPLPWAAFLWLAFLVGGGCLALAVREPGTATPLQPPGGLHWFGTDLLGRDFGWRFLAGGGHTFFVALGSAAVSVGLGGCWGIAAGAAGGRLDRILGRGMDAALAIPALILALVILAALGPGDGAVVLAVGVGGAATFARLARAEAAQIRGREFIFAARAIGAGRFCRIVRHFLPNIAGPLTAYAALHFGWAVINVAALTFLGFGGAPSSPEWGRMLAEARLVFGQAPWQAAVPAFGLALTVLSVQRAGEWWLERTRR
jgi:peptide/nickel transport system permease protein